MRSRERLSDIRSSTLQLSSPRFWSIIICSLALATLVAAAGCDRGTRFKSTDITGADYGRTLELTDHNGRSRSLADWRGKAVVVFFGFTHCPDVCPTTLADVSQAIKQLGPDAQRIQVLFVTVDPERDTQEALGKYVTAFDPGFIGLYGDAAATQRAAKEFKVYYEKRKTDTGYSVDHSAQSYVIDPQGRLRLFVRHDRIGADLADDLRTLLKGG
jgi:protein SCO1